MTNVRYYRISRSNKRKRTITIEVHYMNGDVVRYRSTPLSRDDFNYYTNHATENDIKNFLKTDDYYEIR